MKKIILTLAAALLFAAAGTYKASLVNSIHTLEDLTEWIAADVENGSIDSLTAQTYLQNIEIVLKDLKNHK
jgi:hypothetical protein